MTDCVTCGGFGWIDDPTEPDRDLDDILGPHAPMVPCPTCNPDGDQ